MADEEDTNFVSKAELKDALDALRSELTEAIQSNAKENTDKTITGVNTIVTRSISKFTEENNKRFQSIEKNLTEMNERYDRMEAQNSEMLDTIAKLTKEMAIAEAKIHIDVEKNNAFDRDTDPTIFRLSCTEPVTIITLCVS